MQELQGLAKRSFRCGESMILLVDFDSAWTPSNSGAIAGLLVAGGGDFREIGPPQVVNYSQAEQLILNWQRQFQPNRGQSRIEMFGPAAPVWNFLRRFGGAADPLRLTDRTQVIETYPVLVLICPQMAPEWPGRIWHTAEIQSSADENLFVE